MPELQFPAPYFGGKSTIASKVWNALGDVDHYMEPFFGSGAVLLARPNYDPRRCTETVNDCDAWLCNVWRALQFKPDETAIWCDWPVNHCDLTARKKVLIANEGYLREHLIADPEWCDPKLAGYWIWAASCWIGSGLTRPNQRPHLADDGRGVHKLGKIPHLADDGVGVHKLGKIPHLADDGVGVGKPYNTNLYAWFRELSERLRYVRVTCGDWSIICGGNWQHNWPTVGMFFDPPYSDIDRDVSVYHHDSTTVALDAAKWAVERGKLPQYRIVFAGYDSEHSILDEAGWRRELWKTGGGYGNIARNGKQTRGQENRKREVLWYSPHCLNHNDTLFGNA